MSFGLSKAPAASEWIGASPHCLGISANVDTEDSTD